MSVFPQGGSTEIRCLHFEYPEGWLDTDPLMNSHLPLIRNVERIARDMCLQFKTTVQRRLTDFAPRFASPGTLLLSVHSIGIAQNCIRIKEAYLPGYYYFDRTGYGGWAEISTSATLQAAAANYSPANKLGRISGLRAEKTKHNASKYPQPHAAARIDSVERGKYVLVALQLRDDSVALLADEDLVSCLDIIGAVARTQGYQVVVKRHPHCKSIYVTERLNASRKSISSIFCSQESINTLISGASAVITTNSGVGFEALLMGRPVITFGKSDYSWLTYNISSKLDISKLRIAEQNSYIDERAQNFVLFCLDKYWTRNDDYTGLKEKIAQLIKNEVSNTPLDDETRRSQSEFLFDYCSHVEAIRRDRFVSERPTNAFRRISSSSLRVIRAMLRAPRR